jgi:polyhydroxybutyrate depolymerase
MCIQKAVGGAGLRLTVFLVAMTVFAAVALLGPGAAVPQAIGAGCGPPRPHTSGTTVETISTVDGLRSYRVHVPPSYTGTTRVPLILNFHGLGSNALAEEIYSGLGVRADQPDGGFVVVMPEGTLGQYGRYWNTYQIDAAPHDVAFAAAILDRLEATLCIDRARVFAAGMSNGAMMSVRLACSLSSRIAAAAPVAGAYYPALFVGYPAESCPDARPAPIIAFHGTADTIVPYNGGHGYADTDFRLAIDNDTADEDILQDWAAHNGCTSGRQQTAVSAEVNLIQYSGCNEGADVELYSVVGGGHTWPGAGDVPGFYTTHDISATDLMWAFFQAHPNPDTPAGDIDNDGIPDSLDADADGDGCPNVKEQGPDPSHGGQRDPKNPWDYFNPTQDGVNRTDDLAAVVMRYGHDLGDPMYGMRYDRTAFPGGHPWQFGPPDGLIRTADITAVVMSYGHDCS